MLKPMGASLCFTKCSLAAIALSLLLSRGCSFSLSSSLVAVLVVLLSSSFPFIFSKIKRLHHADEMEELLPEEVDAHENKATQEDEQLSTFSDSSVGSDVCGVPSVCSDCSVSDDEPLVKDARQLKDCSEGWISDDDNLIEITLPDGHYIGQMSEDLLKDFSPESVFRQHGLMELSSEEDNLIEIDINAGSIKCSRLGIKA